MGRLPLLLILALALGLRLWGIQFGLPNLWCRPDEGTLVNKAMAMGTGDLNPHFFHYPSFSFYVLAALYGAYFGAGRLVGLFDGVADFQRQFFVDASSFYLLGRVLVAGLGSASVLAVHRIAREMEGRRAGLIAAFLLAVAYLHVRDSHFLTVDVPATLLMLVSCVWLMRYVACPEAKSLVACGALLGLATSTKYNLGLFGFWPLVAPWLVRDAALLPRRRVRHALLAGAAMAAAFLAASPFIALDFASFQRDLSFERSHFAAGNGVDLHADWTYHVIFTLRHGLGWPLLALALLGCVMLVRRRRPGDLLLLAGIVTYFAVASAGRTVFVRYMIPLVPLLVIAAAIALARLSAQWRPAVGGALAVLVAVPSIVSDVRYDSLLTRPDTRLAAAEWLRSHAPGGSRIAMEGDHFGYPHVHRNRECLAEQLEDHRAAGRDGRRLLRMLEIDGYPPEPSYYVLELNEPGDPPLRVERGTYSVGMLREEGVEWVIIQDHPLQHSRGDPAFREALRREGRLAVRMDPIRPDGPAPIFDPLDAFYVPYAGFTGVRQPGPGLSIYRLP